MNTGGESERIRAADVRHGQVAQCQRRARQDQEERRDSDDRLHLQVGRRPARSRTHQDQEEIKGSRPEWREHFVSVAMIFCLSEIIGIQLNYFRETKSVSFFRIPE